MPNVRQGVFRIDLELSVKYKNQRFIAMRGDEPAQNVFRIAKVLLLFLLRGTGAVH